jgi:ATP-dependent helicase HrpB
MSHLSSLTKGIAQHRYTVLEAPPGSGKTTILPLALSEDDWLEDKKILVLQPRRIATKGVAARMAELLGEKIGDTVGYRIRLESRVSKRTRVEILTEGLLTKRILADPELTDVGAIIFDEFHERSAHADLGLSLCREVASVLRDDLRIIVMSATLGENIPTTAFDGAWRYAFEGTPYPVSIVHRSEDFKSPLWERVARAVKDAAERYDGDILVFLPGAYEIDRTRSLLEQSKLTARILPLYGDLSYSEQQRAMLPEPSGMRKVVLATPIAETSLTIDGVRVIIDSGLHKIARSDNRGTTSLRTERISKDAADQRAGRAGRTAAGVCIRLWSEHEHATLRASREPEIVRSDLTPFLLDLAVWGIRDFSAFQWITQPSESALVTARNTLTQLGALSADGVTPLGKILSNLGTHPRFGRMILEARRWGLEDTAAALIPLLEERDIFSQDARGALITDRIEAINSIRASSPHFQRVQSLKERWTERMAHTPRDLLGPPPGDTIPSGFEAGFLLSTAFPEKVGKRRERGSSKYLLASGSAAAVRDGDPLREHEYIVVAAMHEGLEDGRILLAAPLHPDLFDGPLRDLVSRERLVSFDQDRGALSTKVVERIGAITIREEIHHQANPDEMREALLSWLATEQGFSRLSFSETSSALRTRVAWAQVVYPNVELPALSDTALRADLHRWLAPFLPERATLTSLSSELLDKALEALLPWNLRRQLDALAPEVIALPSGRTRRLRYEQGGPPILEAMIQELFGWQETPTVGPNRTPISLHLLSPARRPMQVTQDLKSFWENGYPLVRKELRGRYPKHKWPEDPREL